ncbi:MAG: hypothetical protein K0R38_730 [Polyangiaceae bacterium]|jgi:hypothetical protein|nr:hypothetical protein [Polyangiaceae bacterium]
MQKSLEAPGGAGGHGVADTVADVTGAGVAIEASGAALGAIGTSLEAIGAEVE